MSQIPSSINTPKKCHYTKMQLNCSSPHVTKKNPAEWKRRRTNSWSSWRNWTAKQKPHQNSVRDCVMDGEEFSFVMFKCYDTRIEFHDEIRQFFFSMVMSLLLLKNYCDQLCTARCKPMSNIKCTGYTGNEPTVHFINAFKGMKKFTVGSLSVHQQCTDLCNVM